jgi:hypothetical protein
MAGLIVAGLLVTSLLVVHLSLRRQPLPSARPLNVDGGLPLPEIGQVSTVFSLTALFGAYLGLYLILGVPALCGLAAGTVGALILVRRWIDASHPESFEAYLCRMLGSSDTNATSAALCFAAVQCTFATSEMTILREYARASLGLRHEHANLLVISLAVIAYFYILFGGYLALFRTDVVQFIYVAVMVLGVLGVVVTRGGWAGWHVPLTPRPGYWSTSVIPGQSHGLLLYASHIGMAALMGLGFIVASPDVWKRVYLVSKTRQGSKRRFALFVSAGAAPFLLLVPMAGAVPHIPDGAIDANAMWARAATNEGLFVATALCLVASFLSAYNGALTLAVHLGVVAQRRMQPADNELSRFYWLMAAALCVIVCGFAALSSARNPYLLGNFLLGPYAVLAGIYLGGRGSIESFPRGAVLWIVTLGTIGWFVYFASHGLPETPSTYQINTVPVAVLLACLVTSVSRLLVRRPTE